MVLTQAPVRHLANRALLAHSVEMEHLYALAVQQENTHLLAPQHASSVKLARILLLVLAHVQDVAQAHTAWLALDRVQTVARDQPHQLSALHRYPRALDVLMVLTH